LARAIIAYASISWLLLQVVQTFIEGLGLPNWVFSGFLIILIAGTPILMLAAQTSARRTQRSHAGAPNGGRGNITFRKAVIGGGLMIMLWVAGVSAFMLSWAFGIGPVASLLASGTLRQSDPILIADFANRTRDPTLASTVTETIRLDLSQSNVIRVVDRDLLGDALDRMNRDSKEPLSPEVARDLAVREGMPAVLEGEVASLGPATLIVARLVDPRNGSVLAEYHDRARRPDELLDAVDRLSGTLRNKIGESLTTIRGEPPLAKVTTSSIVALRSFTQAVAAHGEGDKDRAIRLLREALTNDPNFPMAWRKLGALLGDDEPSAAKQAYTNAYRLRFNLPERERGLAEGSYFKNVEHNLPMAMEAYRRVIASYPEDEVALNNLANLYTAFQKPHEAVKLQERIVRVQPRFAAYSNLFNSLVRLGRLERAAEVHQIAARLYPDQKKIKFQPIILAVAKGDLTGADRLMDEFLVANRSRPELVNDLFIARYEWKRGRLERAKTIFRERARMASEKGNTGNAIDAMTSLVAIARAAGNLDEGRSVLANALTAYPLESIAEDLRPHIDLAEAYALVGDAAQAKRHLALSREHRGEEGSLNYDQRRRVAGLIALAEGRSEEAFQILYSASRFGQCSTCLLFDLGLAAEAAGKEPEAIATYQRYISQAPFALGRGEQLGFAMARLAALQQKAGDVQAAENSRRALRKLWSRADEALLASIDALDTQLHG